MNILLLAPHPFYQDRGTPIAVDLLLRVFSERGDRVDVVTYHEGRSVNYVNVTIHRILSLPFLRDIPPGFSFKKLVCDCLMSLKVFRLSIKTHYDVVHAVEESVFMAIFVRFMFGYPYIYDMDSSMPQQLMEKYPQLSSIRKIMQFFEGMAVKKSEAVVPVCQSLADIAEKHRAKRIVLLPDISLLQEGFHVNYHYQIKRSHSIQGLICMYVGNLEGYQGIDLLLESFAEVLKENPASALVIIGGASHHIQKYKEKTVRLKIASSVFFLGPKPADQLGEYLMQADILVSPRIQGNNTPMKIYSYLHSGKPLLATDLPTHTQVLNAEVAFLVEANPKQFSEGMTTLLKDSNLRGRLGKAGRNLVETEYSFNSFREKLTGLYEILEDEFVKPPA